MSRIPIPRGGPGGQQAARTARPVDPSRIGQAVDRFGQAMVDTAQVVRQAQRRDQREADDLAVARARVTAAETLGAARLEIEQETDPAKIGPAWQARVQEGRTALLEGLSPEAAERAGLAYDGLAVTHGLHVGERQINLRRDQEAAGLFRLSEALTTQAPTLDADGRLALRQTYDEALAQAVQGGILSAADAASRSAALAAELDQAAALAALTDDPAAAVEGLSGDAFPALPADTRERLRAQGLGEIERRAAAEEKRVAAVAQAEARELAGQLKDVTANARDGRVTEGEAALLADPRAAGLPELEEARAAVELRQTIPAWSNLTVAEMDAAIAAERAKPVGARYEARVLDAMVAARNAAAKAWEADPVAQAARLDSLPPPPDLNAEGGFAARRTWAETVVAAGYIDDPVYFSAAEQEQLRERASGATPPEQRAALARALAEGFGDAAPAALAQIGADPVFGWTGGLLAAGGSPAVAVATFEGARALAEKTVALPKPAVVSAAIAEAVGPVFDPSLDAATLAQIRNTANALYARRAGFLDPGEDEDAAASLYREALQDVLGRGVDARGRQTGGVQDVNGAPTLLPIGIAGADVDLAIAAFERALDRDAIAAEAALTALTDSGSAPTYGGRPLDARGLSRLRLVPVAPGSYRLENADGRAVYDGDAVWIVELDRLVEAGRSLAALPSGRGDRRDGR